MEERATTVFAAVSLANEVDASESCLMGQVHDLLLVLSVPDEVRAAAQRAFSWSAFATSMNGERRAVRLGIGHCNTRQIERKHGVFIK